MTVPDNYAREAFDSPSPYPPSSPSLDDSDDEMPRLPTTKAAFRSSLDSVSDSTLRSIVSKLADSNPYFRKGIMKELASASVRPPTTTSPTSKRTHRRKNHRNRKNLFTSSSTHRRKLLSLSSESPSSPDDSMYHPGHLEDELYEFLSRTPDDVPLNIIRTIAMWSCCDEDEWSPGCVMAPSYPLPEGHQPDIIRFSYDAFSDSDLEHHSVHEPALCLSEVTGT